MKSGNTVNQNTASPACLGTKTIHDAPHLNAFGRPAGIFSRDYPYEGGQKGRLAR
jgi:hypothetical protein